MEKCKWWKSGCTKRLIDGLTVCPDGMDNQTVLCHTFPNKPRSFTMEKYQTRWVIFCRKNGYKLSANNRAEYIAWINLMAKVYKMENNIENILDQEKFTNFLKKSSCGNNF